MSAFNLTQSCLDAGFLSPIPPIVSVQTIAETLPIITNQGPNNRCWSWFAEPYPQSGAPPDKEEIGCAGPGMKGRFTVGSFDWEYPSDYNKSPGYSGSVTGESGTPLTISLTNNAKGLDCDRGPEMNLAFDYPNSGLGDIADVDFSTYDSIIIEYDIAIKSATTDAADCNCLRNGQPQCPDWWKSHFYTDLIFYQGPQKDLNVISIRHFDPQNDPESSWSTPDPDHGYRYQFSDHQVSPTVGATAHVKVDAKALIAQYNSQLCQGPGITGPINFRAIQLVSKVTGADMTVDISNVKANAYKYVAGTFTTTAPAPGCTPKHCPTQPTDPTKSCTP